MRNSTKTVVSVTGALVIAALLTACDQVPSLDAQDQTANKKACESISSSWNSLSSALSTANVVAIGQAVQDLPKQADIALSTAKDNQLTFNLNSLKSQAQAIIAGGQPDISALAGTGIGLAARCALLGSTASIQLPKF